MLPAVMHRSRRSLIWSAFRFQSFPMTLQWIPRNPCAGSTVRRAGDRSPNGGRNKVGDVPVAAAMASCARATSADTRECEHRGRQGCEYVWLPIAWPASTIKRATSGRRLTLRPQTKNVAGTFNRWSASMNRAVSLLGPSSNVSAISAALPGSAWMLDPQRWDVGQAAA